MATDEAVLFRSDNLAVRKIGGFSSACCVVTFDSFTDTRTLDRAGFGEHFLQSRHIDAIHVVSRENDWYQYPEMAAAMTVVHAATRGYDRVVTYGSSMGAYAAIRLAGLAGANVALAMSPQYSIDPAVAAFERRWRDASKRFRPVWERDLPFPTLPEAYVVYDPEDQDRRHVALFQQDFAFTPVPLPHAGHTVSGYLLEVGLLQAAVLAVCRAEFDPASFIALAWQRREQSPQYFLTLGERARSRPHRIAMMQRALDLTPRNIGCLSRLGLELGAAKRFPEALALHRRALAIEPEHPGLLNNYSLTLQKSGDFAAALAVMEKVSAQTNGATLYVARLHRLRARVRASDPWLRRIYAASRKVIAPR
ncbi:tetratricopeptide repeat protein [Acidisphaera sp. L21]|uniref:tetratricopeptide repeat protein n=1 Tax=Acidisphaera sp. L21 TaxID=1641851 RepID=UPI00131E43A2|nr:alpha/beta fold hydrolase [Acidisphaera sp. L21]